MTASDLGALLPLVLLGVLLLVLFRTNRSRLRAAQDLQQKLAPGQQIMTTAGLYGTAARFVPPSTAEGFDRVDVVVAGRRAEGTRHAGADQRARVR